MTKYQKLCEEAAEQARKVDHVDSVDKDHVDYSLILKARKNITGSNIHEAIGLIARIQGHHRYLDRHKNDKDDSYKEFTEKTKEWMLRDRKYLIHFVKTGDVPANYNNYCGLGHE